MEEQDRKFLFSIGVDCDKLELDEEEAKTFHKYRSLADRMCHERITIVEKPKSRQGLKEFLASSDASLLKGTAQKPTVFVFDTKLTGEAMTNPLTRKPPLKVKDFEEIFPAIFESRSPSGKEILPGDVFMFFDGGRDTRLNRIKNVHVHRHLRKKGHTKANATRQIHKGEFVLQSRIS